MHSRKIIVARAYPANFLFSIFFFLSLFSFYSAPNPGRPTPIPVHITQTYRWPMGPSSRTSGHSLAYWPALWAVYFWWHSSSWWWYGCAARRDAIAIITRIRATGAAAAQPTATATSAFSAATTMAAWASAHWRTMVANQCRICIASAGRRVT